MKITVTFLSKLFHCHLHCFLLLFFSFLNTTGIPLVLLKKGNIIFIEITVDIFLFQSIGWRALYLIIDVIND